MARLRLTTDPAQTRGCTRMGAVNDDSVKDLRRKIVRAGGNTALLIFGVEDMSRIYAEVFRSRPRRRSRRRRQLAFPRRRRLRCHLPRAAAAGALRRARPAPERHYDDWRP